MTSADASPMQVLRDEILDDAQRQAERLRRRAERDARDILKEADKEAKEDREARLDEARRQAERTRDLVLARVPVEVGRMRAQRLEDALEAVRGRARQRLAEAGADRERVAALAAEAAGCIAGDAVVLELAAEDVPRFGDGLAEDVVRRAGREGLQVSVVERPGTPGDGVVVRDPDGRQVWDNRLAARLDRMWPALRRHVAGRFLRREPAAEAEKES